ncbi:tripartite tricarboxylate transporter substrate binding protein [Pusillimonas sp. SM2304]|uniref:Bug family tripartite tricarboxylate transporter substrate binding protein n=1 Tax=Pusillimonas sp. SM2304 TaxID=3073241 RepID=UPI002875C6EE|nr:tripartite tricarboxylate transporter substrate binding protein [Pusillimonas sp. SM2304]MDS1140247.1 tripartite tricarboxylate transporter substrate binding protein [Pusillimonas sp. SM2304]
MKKALKIAIAACCAAAFAVPAAAQSDAAANYPAKPIKLIVPFPAGGTSDVLGRLVGDKLGQAFGQTVVVENRAGANGNIGADYVARSDADGYTLLLVDLGNLTISPSVYPNMPFDPLKDLTPVTMLAFSPHLLVTSNALPVKTQDELVAYAKANPGKVNFAAAAGIGSAPHMAGVLFAQKTGVDWGYIPYKGGAQAMTDLIGGQVDATTNGMVATYPHVKSGKIRLLAVTSEKRLPQLPDVPTVSEKIPGFVTGSWQGVLAPAGTPAAIVEKLNTEMAKIIKMPDVQEKLLTLGAEPMDMTTAEFNTWMHTQVANWAVVVKEAGIKIE